MQAGRWDFLGYYELLGLKAATEGNACRLSDADIKRAYREAAKRWHPDRREVLGEQDRSVAHQRFQVKADVRFCSRCIRNEHWVA